MYDEIFEKGEKREWLLKTNRKYFIIICILKLKNQQNKDNDLLFNPVVLKSTKGQNNE